MPNNEEMNHTKTRSPPLLTIATSAFLFLDRPELDLGASSVLFLTCVFILK